MIVIIEIVGIGDVDAGIWRFCSAVPSYGGDECKPWLTEMPSIRGEQVDLRTGQISLGDLQFRLLDGTSDQPMAISRLFGSAVKPASYLSEDISASDTAFEIYRRGAFEDGSLMWIGREVLERGANSGSDITVTRARLGSTAKNHKSGTPIYPRMPNLGGAIVRVYESPSDATSSGDEVLIGRYSIDSARLIDGVAWEISASSSLGFASGYIATGVAQPSICDDISRDGVLRFTPQGQAAYRGNPYSREASLWPEGSFVLLGEELIAVDTAEDPFALTVLRRGDCGTQQTDEPSGQTIAPALAAPYSAGGSFRYSSTNSTTRASGWSSSTHWVDVILCLMTSSASPEDGLELVNGDATYGNWSCLSPGWGAGIRVSEIDLASFALAKKRTMGVGLDNMIIEAKAMPLSDLLRPVLYAVGAALSTVEGKITVSLLGSPSLGEALTEIDSDRLIDHPEIEGLLSRQVGRVGIEIRSMTGDEIEETVLAVDVPSVPTDSQSQVESATIEAPIASHCVPTWMLMRAAEIAMLAARPSWMVKANVSPNAEIALADQVYVTAENLPALAGGDVGWDSVPAIVTRVDRRYGVDHALEIEMQAIADRPAKIAPSALISSVSSLAITVAANEFSQTGETGLPATDASAFAVGQIVTIVLADGQDATGGNLTAEITNISGNVITVDDAMGGAISAGRIVVLAGFDDAVQDDQAEIAWQADLTEQAIDQPDAISRATIHWSMQSSEISGSTVSDLGTAGVDGTLVDSPLTGQPAYLAAFDAVDFDGVSERCEVPFSSIPTPSSSMTLAGCFRADDDAEGRIAVAIGISVGTAYCGVWVERWSDGRLLFVLQGGSAGTERLIWSTKTYPDGEWLAFVASWDGTDAVLHIRSETKSETVDETPGSDPLAFDATGYFRVGGRHDQLGNRYFDGRIADGRWWNGTVLTTEQATEYLDKYMGSSALREQPRTWGTR